MFMIGAFELALAASRIAPKLTEAFLTGQGVGWHEHDHQLFHGIERFFRSGYTANLIQSWIRRSRVWRQNCAPARMSPISAAAMARRRS